MRREPLGRRGGGELWAVGTACAKALSGREGSEFGAWMEVSEARWRRGDWEAGEAGGEVAGQALLDQVSHGEGEGEAVLFLSLDRWRASEGSRREA